MRRGGENVRQSTSLHSISYRFLRFIGRFRRRRMDGTAVGCRYFGLGDDRPYFHPSVPSYLLLPRTRAVRASMYIYTYRDILHSRTVRPVLRAKQRPTFRTQRKLADGGLSSQRSLPRFFVFFFLFLPLSLFFSYRGSF